MKRIQIIGLALVAVFAFSAMLAVSASAETTLLVEWLAKGAEVTTNMATETKGKILLEDSKVPLIGKVAVECEGILDGTVGANGADSITKLLTTGGVEIGELTGTGLKCEKETACEAASASPVEVWPLNLPWATLAFLMENGTFLDLILGSTYHVKCLVLGINAEDECTAAETSLPLENGATFVLTASGSTAEPLASCTQGGANSGVNTTIGESKITLNSGEALQVVSE
jgi:hypothetical protein